MSGFDPMIGDGSVGILGVRAGGGGFDSMGSFTGSEDEREVMGGGAKNDDEWAGARESMWSMCPGVGIGGTGMGGVGMGGLSIGPAEVEIRLCCGVTAVLSGFCVVCTIAGGWRDRFVKTHSVAACSCGKIVLTIEALPESSNPLCETSGMLQDELHPLQVNLIVIFWESAIRFSIPHP